MQEEFGFSAGEKTQGRKCLIFCGRFLWAVMIGVSVFLASRSL